MEDTAVEMSETVDCFLPQLKLAGYETRLHFYLMTRASWPLVPHLKLFFSEYFNDFRVDSIAFVLVYSCKGRKGGEGNVTSHIARFLQDVNDSHVQHLPTVSSISLPKNLGMNPLGQPSFYSQNTEMLTESVAILEPPACQFQNIKYHQFPQIHHLHPNLLFHPKLFTIYAPIRKSFACFAELDKDTPNLASRSWIWTTVCSLSNCPSCQVDFWFSEKWLRRPKGSFGRRAVIKRWLSSIVMEDCPTDCPTRSFIKDRPT